jgi:hypothetical protein
MSIHHIHPPTSADIFRYRTHHGTNLGSIFVLERWLFPSMYHASVAGDSEHDAVISYVRLPLPFSFRSIHPIKPSLSDPSTPSASPPQNKNGRRTGRTH